MAISSLEVVETAPEYAQFTVDTTQRSFLHRLMKHRRGFRGSRFVAYASAAAACFLPMVVVALLTTDHRAAKLPFFLDLNNAFMFLVSFPTLMLLTVTDDSVLRDALQRIQVDGILFLPQVGAADDLRRRWQLRFSRLNSVSAWVGLLTAAAVVSANYYTYTRPDIGFWAAPHGRYVALGYVFLYGIFLFYGLLPIYVIRTTAISFLLRDLVKHAQLSMLPGHPDRCGGLRPIGRMGLRNQYALTVCGLNVALLVIVSFHYLNVPSALNGLIAAAGIAYVVLGPIVFFGSLLSFRGGMLRTRAELMSEVAQRLRVELRRLRKELPSGKITKDDEEMVDRLRKVGAVIYELPVWPFDAGTLRRFLTAYVMPLVGGMAYLGLREFVADLLQQLAKSNLGL